MIILIMIECLNTMKKYHKNSAKRFKIQTLVILFKSRLELHGACVWETSQDITPICLWLMHSIFILLVLISRERSQNDSNYLSPEKKGDHMVSIMLL